MKRSYNADTERGIRDFEWINRLAEKEGFLLPGVGTRPGQKVLGLNKQKSYYVGGFPKHELFIKKGGRFEKKNVRHVAGQLCAEYSFQLLGLIS